MSSFDKVIRVSANHVDLLVRVSPNSSKDEIGDIMQTGEDEFRLTIKVRAVPDKGKANKAVILLLAKILGVAKTSISVASGTTHRMKTLRVEADVEMIVSAISRIS